MHQQNQKIHELPELSGTSVTEAVAKSLPSRYGASVSTVGASYRRPRELGEHIAEGDEIATVDGIVEAKNSIGMRMRSEWLLRVWTTAPHTKATQEARDIRMASYANVGSMYE